MLFRSRRPRISPLVRLGWPLYSHMTITNVVYHTNNSIPSFSLQYIPFIHPLYFSSSLPSSKVIWSFIVFALPGPADEGSVSFFTPRYLELVQDIKVRGVCKEEGAESLVQSVCGTDLKLDILCSGMYLVLSRMQS